MSDGRARTHGHGSKGEGASRASSSESEQTSVTSTDDGRGTDDARDTGADASTDVPAPRPGDQSRVNAGLLAWVAASFCAWFSDAAFVVGLGWTALHTLSPTAAGVVVAMAGLTQFVTGFFGGVVADRHDPRTILRLCAASELVTLACALMFWHNGVHGPTLFGVTAVFGLLAGMSRPARTAWTRSLVEGEAMTRLVSWTQMASRAAQFSGAPAGAFVVGLWGFTGTLMLAALGPIAMTLTLIGLRARVQLPRASDAGFRSALDGLRYLRDHRDARRLVIGISATNVCIIPLMAIGLAMVASESHWGAAWVGYGEAAVAVSALVGSAVAPTLTRGRPARVSFLLLMLQGVAIPFVTVGAHALYLGALAAIGFTAGIASVQLSAIYLGAIDPAFLGRVGSWLGALDLTLGPVVTPIWTRLASVTSLVTTGLTFGTACVVLGGMLTAVTWSVGTGSQNGR